MTIEIDKHAGFCFGVRRAVEMAEKALAMEGMLYCLGDLVHNEKELERLHKLGLKTIDHETFKTLRNCRVLIRAHGEPPETYHIAKQNNIELIGATCPVVLKLQNKVEKAYLEMTEKEGQVLIFGKKDHAEVIGLNGQTGYNAIIIEKDEDLNNIDFTKPIHLFAQTTKDKHDYALLIEKIKKVVAERGASVNEVKCTQSVCNHVSGRVPHLQEFCNRFNIVLFVSSPKSSNGRVLYEECRLINKNTHFITGYEDIKPEWFNKIDSVGITGATSTPVWLMEQVAEKVKEIIKN
jgi:4-hydroxy-3-methylbut-2-enyl diphosphate reductase